MTGAPLLLLLGGRDDYTPPGPCQGYAEWLRSKGALAEVVVYPDAVHGFDGGGGRTFGSGLVTARNCNGLYDLDQLRIRIRDTGEDITARARDYFAGCLSRGASVGGDPEARRRAPVDVKAFLAGALKLQAKRPQ